MKNITRLLLSQTINSLTYSTVYVELPVPDITRFIDWKNILTNPPLNSSKTTLKELETISKFTNNISKNDLKLIYDIDSNIDSFFVALLHKYNLTYPYAYISEWYSVISPILKNIKYFWNRPRPYQLAEYYNIPINMIVTDTIDTPAYPSGHTVYSSLVSHILKDMYPQINILELNNIVNQTSIARIKQGVHYPSDTKAGNILANYLFNNLKQKFKDY